VTADRIKCVEVELRSGNVAVARAASERVSRAWSERLAPVVARVCAERGGEVLHRVERLEVDLGAIDVEVLEGELATRLEAALRAALDTALARRRGRDARVDAALEVVESVALTGYVPWWAADQPRAVAAHFARAAGAAERELLAILRRVGRDPIAVERLARLADGDALVRLVERTRPEVRELPRGADRHERRVLLGLLVEAATREVEARHERAKTEAVGARDAAIVRDATPAAHVSNAAVAAAREAARAPDAAQEAPPAR